MSFFLTWCREIAYTFHITDDASEVVHVFGVAMRTLVEITFVNMSTVVADSVGNIESEVVAAFLCRNTQKLSVLGF